MRTPLSDYKLRLSQELKDQIAAAAEANNRSMNSEIIARLERTFAEDQEGSGEQPRRGGMKFMKLAREASTNAWDEARIREVVKAVFEEDYEGRIDKLDDAVAGLTELLRETRMKLGL